jgi:putative transposase
MAGAVEKLEARVDRSDATEEKRKRKGMSAEEVAREKERAGELSMGKMLRCRVRYFTDGVVIGSRGFVNEAFASARERFGPKRKDGARMMRGKDAVAAEWLWSLRDLRKGVG